MDPLFSYYSLRSLPASSLLHPPKRTAALEKNLDALGSFPSWVAAENRAARPRPGKGGDLNITRSIPGRGQTTERYRVKLIYDTKSQLLCPFALMKIPALLLQEVVIHMRSNMPTKYGVLRMRSEMALDRIWAAGPQLLASLVGYAPCRKVQPIHEDHDSSAVGWYRW